MPRSVFIERINTFWADMSLGFITVFACLGHLLRKQNEQHEDTMRHIQGLGYYIGYINELLPQDSGVASQEDVKKTHGLVQKTRKDMVVLMKNLKDEVYHLKVEMTRMNNMLKELMRSRENPERKASRKYV
jgi:hypothetical protein